MLEFLVHDAERSFGEAGKISKLSFWTYKVMTRSYLPSYQNPPIFPKKSPGPSTNFIVQENSVDYCAWHRYSDFEWLQQRLQAEFPGEIFPPIPEKDAEGTADKIKDLFSGGNDHDMSSKHPLVMRRMRRLQLFLQYIAEKKVVHESTVLKAFISMEEAEWLAYKDEVNKANKTSAWDSVRAAAGGLFSSAKKASGKDTLVLDDASNIGRVRLMQQRFSGSLMVCMRQLVNMVKWGQPVAQPEQLDELCRRNANMALAPSLVYNGHMVRDGKHDHGVVRHVEGSTAYVSWSDDPSSIEGVNINALQYPQSGIVDPAMFVVQEMVTQIDSFLHYVQFRNDSAQMEKLIDLLWFWSRYAECVGLVVGQLEEVERERASAADDAAKEKKPEKKTQLEQRAKELGDKFTKACATFESDYAFRFRPLQKKAYLQILTLFGEVSVTLLNDADWGERMQRADAALPLSFDISPEVAAAIERDAQQQAAAESSAKDAAPLPPAAVAAVAAAVPEWDVPAYVPPAQSAKRQPSPPASRHADPEYMPAPTYSRDSASAAGTGATSEWVPPPAALVDDEVPPPPPPPPVAAPGEGSPNGSMVDANWMQRPTATAAEPQLPAADGDEPPPLPPSGHNEV